MFTSATQPYCRCCGKPIKKFTVTHYFGQGPNMAGRGNRFSSYHGEEARTKAEAQRYLNQRIVSTRKGYAGHVVVGTWDEESYHDGLFCAIQCAAAFGRMAAEVYPGLETQAAFEARAARREKGIK